MFETRKSLIVAFALCSFFLALSTTSFVGCGGDSDGNGSANSASFQQAKQMSQVALILGFGFTGVLAPQNIKAGEFPTGPCANGGNIVPNPDGSITFNKCSPFPGLELDGTLKEEIDEDGNIDSEFDNFGGNFNGNEFRIDGKIDQRNGPGGTDDFTFDLELKTPDADGNLDTWRLDAELNLDENNKLNGEMKIRNNTGGADCFFNGTNALELIQDDSSDAMDKNCDPVDNDVPFA